MENNNNNNNGFKVWNNETNKWAISSVYFVDSDGILRKFINGVLIEAPKQYKLVKATTLIDEWDKIGDKKDNEGIIYEGDYVYLHSKYDTKQVTEIAEVIWSEEENGWSFETIEDIYISDEHNISPRVVGNKYENPNFPNSECWKEFLKEEQRKSKKREEKRILNDKKRMLRSLNKSYESQIKEIEDKQKANDIKLKELKIKSD